MGSKGQTFLSDLNKSDKKGDQRGKIIVRADTVKDSNWEVQMEVNATSLPNNAACFCFDNNNSLLEISRGSQDQTMFFKVFRSEVVHGTRNPMYNAFKIKGSQLCNSNKDLPIQFKVINRTGDNDREIGSCVTTLNEMASKKEFELTNARNKQRIAGTINIEKLNVVEVPTFVDYLRSGWGISLSVAIDFTLSNRDPKDPASLHYMNDFNQYENAIS